MIAPAVEFAAGFWASLVPHDGMVLVLQAYFDETGNEPNAEVTAIAGFIFDKSGLERFTSAWSEKTNGLSSTYRSAACNARRPPFDAREWRPDEAQAFMDDLARLSVECASAGFAAAVLTDDYRSAVENNPGLAGLVDSPYTLCALSVMWLVGRWADQHGRPDQIHYWFEDGAAHQREAQAFIGRMKAAPGMASQFRIGSETWVPKVSAPALCSADLLVWELQRNIRSTPERWTARMEMLTSQPDTCPILVEVLTEQQITMFGLTNMIHGVHRDD